MRTLIYTFLLFLSTSLVLQAQNREFLPRNGQTIGSENMGHTNVPLLVEAQQLFRQVEFEGALFALDNAVAQNPNSIEALVFRARLKNMIGQQREAKIDIQRAQLLNPYAADLYGYNGNLGVLNLLAMDPEGALKSLSTYKKLNYYYQEIDELLIESNERRKEMTAVEKVVFAIESKQYDSGLQMAEDLLETYPLSAIAHDLKGLLLFKKGQLEDARTSFKMATQLQPTFAISWYNLGQVERQSGNLKLSKQYLDKAIQLEGDLTKAYFERAMLFKAMGKTDEALDDYDRIIELSGSTYLEAYLNRGLTKKMLGDYTGALVDLNKAIEENPMANRAEWYKNRGNLQLLFGYHFRAIEDYTMAIKLEEDFAEAYYNRAIAHLIILDKVSACHDLDQSGALGYAPAVERRPYFCTDN